MDIREFLEARLAEDEATARSALQPAPWWPGDERTVPTEEWTFDWHEVRQRKLDRSRYRNEFTKGDGSPYFVVAECHPGSAQVSRHMARHDPARVLRDVEAKRRILEMSRLADYRSSAMDDVLLLLAAPYAEHPDYAPHWRPS